MWAFQVSPPPSQQLAFFPKHHAASSLSFTPAATFRPSSLSVTSNPELTIQNNNLIQSLCEKGKLKQALESLNQEPNPSQRTYELLLLCCIRQNSLSDGISVHRRLINDGFCEDSFLATKLINMYSDLQSIDHARQVFDEISNRTIFVWNALFRALSLVGKGEEVLIMYRMMNFIGISSDRFTYTYVLKACVSPESSSISLLNKGKEIHAHILRHAYETHVHLTTTLVDMYAKFGRISNASIVFNSISTKNVVSWSAMIACYARNGKPFEALELFSNMMLEGHGLFSPNSVTMVSVLQACSSLAALEQGKLIHGYIIRNHLDSILPINAALITMYGRCGELEKSQSIFDRMNNRDVISWNSLISSYGIHGFGLKAISIFEEMKRLGFSPSPVTFTSVLGACSHAGLVNEGRMIFESIKDHGFYPLVDHYACLVDLLGRANQLDEAAVIIQDMRTEPGSKVWGSLLGACRIHCNVELAERASRRLFELEPKNAGNYVLLADIYAGAKMWEEVKRVRRDLELLGLQKVPGCSWIEVRKKVYAFTSVEELNPQIEQIHALLLRLSMEMKERGYVPETKVVLYDLEDEEKERILLGHSEKLAVGFGLINSGRGEKIRITKNLRLCEDCHAVNKFVSWFAGREILVRDVNRLHCFKDGVCSCNDYW
ncbi:pentatricopeptide repeat-containing protein At3g46790, chloroplastic [Impatiens glandulifera]|uniref:pentatricopeptide repeat-containing protein At3g46790, chloroplastic n=1 Tax=Impatiens glandulifera TaxID=253017 RepID=UPI001FB0A519|nr:pentatricopeptide repeat-containing protein At3g46790, chloroplastic [Impatiens glandulifera]